MLNRNFCKKLFLLTALGISVGTLNNVSVFAGEHPFPDDVIYRPFTDGVIKANDKGQLFFVKTKNKGQSSFDGSKKEDQPFPDILKKVNNKLDTNMNYFFGLANDKTEDLLKRNKEEICILVTNGARLCPKCRKFTRSDLISADCSLRAALDSLSNAFFPEYKVMEIKDAKVFVVPSFECEHCKTKLSSMPNLSFLIKDSIKDLINNFEENLFLYNDTKEIYEIFEKSNKSIKNGKQNKVLFLNSDEIKKFDNFINDPKTELKILTFDELEKAVKVKNS